MRKFLLRLDSEKPVIWCGDMNVIHGDCDVVNMKAKRNKAPGCCDSERENFGMIVGGQGAITEQQRAKRTLPIGRPGGKGLGFVDVWRLLHPCDGEIGHTFWSYRSKGRLKNLGWRLDYFVVSERLKSRVVDILRRNEFWGPSDHIPLVLVTKKQS
uniref:Endonuclease/exonuclease/phosphatase domain-containing protein n=1 Tax=Lotharella oceanica TaxID=641309 RepID=A0A7S2XGU9_9EUKA|mmetsp:Transcript_7286/g.14288  ORF Transcript_7286/g.14288 Transcript_7286/m.14288 type:complete len:156 (+) Transcript_7286:136-603(+)